MMRYFLAGIIILTACFDLNGQGFVGSWSDHLSYSTSNYITAGNDKIFSSTGAAVLILDNLHNDISKLSKASGLTETGICAVAWSDQEETLVIVYKNTNVDLVKKGIITNIPDIKNKYIPGLKEIYNITISGKKALLSGSFGIVVIDLEGRYIADTWHPGPDGDNNIVYETALLGDQIFAATAKGVYQAQNNRAGLSYFGNWERLEDLNSPGASYNKIASAGNSLFLNSVGAVSEEDSVFRIVPGQPAQFILSQPAATVRSIDPTSAGVSVALASSVIMFSAEGSKIREITNYGWASPMPVNTITYNGRLWIADASNGLISTTDFTTYTLHDLPGPYTNNVADICFSGSKAFVTGGTVDNGWGNVYRPLQVFTSSGEHWVSYILYGAADRDAMRVVIDPEDPAHYFVSSWGNGIYEFEDLTLLNNYNQSNSPLTSIISGEPYTRICGMAFDKDGNLWLTQSGVSGNLKALMKDGIWIVTGVNLNVPVISDMVIADNNYIWAILPRGYGILVYDPGETPGDVSDDRYMKMQVEDNDGYVLNNLFSIAKDNDGNIWVGTDMGPLVYYTPERIFESSGAASRIKIPRNDGSGLADYLLSTETITSIAIDGANRKWFGTMSSGAYLVSEDGRTQIHNFSSANSPLLSDNIVKISVNGLNGDVWFGTEAGIISFRGDATAGTEDYADMYVFPNPVREDFEGNVTITGLVEASTVKITDISGNLVYETTSTGGQASWDLRNYRGNRINTGVYLVFVSNSDGSISKVTKFLVIR